MAFLEIPFAKLTGAGNDFVAVNNIDGGLDLDWAAFARLACERHYGIGADGLLVLGPSLRADFTMHYYNADGSEGGMCGNGGRCCVLFAQLTRPGNEAVTFEALNHLYHATFTPDGIRVIMKDPERIRRGLQIRLTSGKMLCHSINTGSPHVVTFVDDLEGIDVGSVGREVRRHSEFQPEGTNVNFVKFLGSDRIAIRTYERGVEAETLACGTGSIASALITAMEKGASSPVTVQARSGEVLQVGFKSDGTKITSISLEGHARIVFNSSLLYDSTSNHIEARISI
jgi:diaminopimelate epimerase